MDAQPPMKSKLSHYPFSGVATPWRLLPFAIRVDEPDERSG